MGIDDKVPATFGTYYIWINAFIQINQINAFNCIFFVLSQSGRYKPQATPCLHLANKLTLREKLIGNHLNKQTRIPVLKSQEMPPFLKMC